MTLLPDSRPLPTPALVVDRAALERNLAAMARTCATAGVRLRAHGKMHKCPALAHLQAAHGAVGLCAQTVGEAEAFAAAGIVGLLVTAPFALHDAPRLAALATPGRRVSAVADHPRQVAALGAAARAAGTTVGLVVEVNVGHHRTGAAPSEAPALARLAAAEPGLRFEGLQGYHGAIQHLEPSVRRAEAEQVARILASLVAELEAAGLPVGTVTGGGTGTFAADLSAGVFTEIQAGSYALMDAQYAAAGAPFEAALFLASTVVSVAKTHVILDAGLKAVSADGGAIPVSGAPAGARFQFAGDEHARLLHPAFPAIFDRDPRAQHAALTALAADASVQAPEDQPALGARVWLQPGHCDPTIALHDTLFVVEAGRVVDRWPVSARRRWADVAMGSSH